MVEQGPKSNKELPSRIQEILEQARKKALSLNHNDIGTEHLLLALLEEDSVASRLKELGFDPSRVRDRVKFIIGSGEHSVSGEPWITPRASKAINLSIKYGQQSGQQEAIPLHLLVGLVQQGEGIAAGVLEASGITLEKLGINPKINSREDTRPEVVVQLENFLSSQEVSPVAKQRVTTAVRKVIERMSRSNKPSTSQT